MEQTSNQPIPWKGYQMISFRFVLIFFILFIICLDWSAIPILSYLYYYGPLSAVLDSVISWVGKDLFDIPYIIVSPYDAEHNDRTYVYLLYFTMTLAAILGTIVWSLLDRKRQNYNLLYYWLTTVVRYYLAFTMFLFALYKFFKMQFPDLGYYTLTEQVGDMSPMHLAWAFFGYSYGYNVFMGIAECAGLLLLFRRTTTFGALLTLGALANVIAVNYSFDVHAKMYPTALFFMALFLLVRDAKSILRFFFTGRAVSLSLIKAPIYKKQWMRISKPVLKVLVVAYFLFIHVKDNISYKSYADESMQAKSEYAGIYDIDSFVVNKDTLSHDDPSRWQQVVIGDRMVEAVRFKKDSIAHANVLVYNKELIVYGDLTDLNSKTQEIYNELGLSDSTWQNMDSILVARQFASSVHFELSDPTSLELKGIINNDSVYITAKRRHMAIEDFRLMKRRFHWINEASYFY